MPSEPERLAVVETEIKNITATVNRTEGKVDEMKELIVNNYVPRTEIESALISIRKEIDNAKTLGWIDRFATALVSASVGGLIAFFFAHIK